MRRGVLGVPEPNSIGAADGITGVEDTVQTRPVDAPGVDELTAAINVQEQRTLTGGGDYYVGEALRERVVEDDSYRVEDGSIKSVTTVDNVVQDYTRFVVAPATDAHSGFMVVSSSDGLFAFGMVSRQNVGRITDADLELGSFYLDREDTFTPQTSGGPTNSFEAGKLTAWGDDVLEDEDLSSLLSSAVRHDRLDQLAGEYIYEEDGSGIPYKVNMARSGYVEVWNPSDLTTGQFLRWVRNEVLPYAGVEDEDDDEEQSTLPGTDEDEGEEGAA